MASGRIEIKHNFTGQPDYVIVEWYKTTAPLAPASGLVNGVVVTRVVYPAPHSEEALLITEVDPMMYVVRFFASVDGINKDSEIPVSLAVDAAQSAINVLTVYTYIVDRGEEGDPVSGSNELRDARLLDKIYNVEERGTGTLVPPSEPSPEWVDRSDDGGGFDFTGGKVFFEGGVYFAKVQERQDVVVAPGGEGGGLSGIVIETSDVTFDINLHGNKSILFNKNAPVATLTIPSLATLGDCRFRVSNYGAAGSGAQRSVVVQFQPLDSVYFHGGNMEKIFIGRSRWVEFIVKDNVIYVTAEDLGYNTLGQMKWTWGAIDEPNTIIADGRLISDVNEYPSLSLILASTTTVPLSSWDTDANRGKWGVTGDQVRVPNLLNNFIRAGSSAAGTHQDGQVGQTTVEVPLSVLTRNDEGATDTKLATGGVTGPPPAPISFIINAGQENRVVNKRLIPHICIG